MADAAQSEEKAERDRIIEALKASDYSPAHAADALGMTRSTMGRRIKAYGLDTWIEQNNQRVQRRRTNRELPPAPHEPSRQAQAQAANRAAGLCGCGKPPDPKPSGEPGRMCDGCRTRARNQKRDKAA